MIIICVQLLPELRIPEPVPSCLGPCFETVGNLEKKKSQRSVITGRQAPLGLFWPPLPVVPVFQRVDLVWRTNYKPHWHRTSGGGSRRDSPHVFSFHPCDLVCLVDVAQSNTHTMYTLYTHCTHSVHTLYTLVSAALVALQVRWLSGAIFSEESLMGNRVIHVSCSLPGLINPEDTDETPFVLINDLSWC